MKKPKRSQNDERQEEYSKRGQVHTPGPDLARQEFRQSTDTNFILSRHGAAGLKAANTAIPQVEVDYDIDLQSALGAIAAVRLAHRRMSKATREKYPTWRDMLTAVEAGTFKLPEEPAAEIPPAVETPKA